MNEVDPKNQSAKNYRERHASPELRLRKYKVKPGPLGKWSAMGHSFFDDMKCNYCGVTFKQHQWWAAKECPMFDLEASKATGKIKYRSNPRKKDKE